MVAAAIIAVLIAILLPAVNRSRQIAQSIQCTANLHSLGQLLVVYSLDHNGCVPLAGNIAPGNSTSNPDDPASLGDSEKRKYVYYDNGGGVMCVTALPAALAMYIGAPAARDDSWNHVDDDIQSPGLQKPFLCPADEATIDRSYGAPRWINNYGSATFLSGWSSYGVNAEIFAWADNGIGGTTGHSRARGKLSAVPRPADTMLMCDTNAAIEIWVMGPDLSLGDVYLGTGGTVGAGVFDLQRHQGRINILFADAHVEGAPILAGGGTAPRAPIGSAGNFPSDDLMAVSMDKGFR